jgi:hypothetical protein
MRCRPSAFASVDTGSIQLKLDDFPRYHPRAAARCRSGFTDISRYGLVSTYPTRNFALRCVRRVRSNSQLLSSCDVFSTVYMSPCRLDHIFTRCLGAWRMASEDSDQLGSGFLAVHRLGDLEKIRKSMPGEVLTVSHPLHTNTNFSKSQRLAVRSGCARKNGITTRSRSARRRTLNVYRCSRWSS